MLKGRRSGSAYAHRFKNEPLWFKYEPPRFKYELPRLKYESSTLEMIVPDVDGNANAALAKRFHATGNGVAAAVKGAASGLEFPGMCTQRGTRLETAMMSPFQQAVSRVGVGLGFPIQETRRAVRARIVTPLKDEEGERHEL